jgi:hypothetical protein
MLDLKASLEGGNDRDDVEEAAARGDPSESGTFPNAKKARRLPK